MTEQDERMRREALQGTWAMESEELLEGTKGKERTEARRAFGLDPAESIRDRKVSLFARGRPLNSGPFGGADFLEDMRELDGYDVAVIGAPYDGATTYRPGTRFGPDAMRRIGASTYNPGMAVDLTESLDIVDVGDIQVIPSNLEKSFDQIAKGIAYIAER
ncbi:MAG: arginase family protein, partial [Chloroflexota bacterium]